MASPSRLHRIVRWVPAILLLALLVGGWLVIRGGGMAGITVWYLYTGLLPLLAGLVFVGVLVYALVKQRLASKAVWLTMALSVLAGLPFLLLVGWLPMAYPVALDEVEPGAMVRLPAHAPLLVAWGGDTVAENYHARTPDQRWAYDLVVEPAFVGSDDVADYGCWGVPVVAPAAATVSSAHDGERDVTPGRLSANITAPFGNYVALRLDETETYLVLAHLQQGSVRVAPGQHVAEGDTLGRCGNSGNTSEPHIHIHHQRQDPEQVPVNFAEGLPLYFRDHDGPAMPTGGLDEVDGAVVPRGAVVQHVGG